MNKIWVESALVRAVKTVAQTAAATIGSAAVISAVDWRVVVSASFLAGILSLLTSLAGLPEVGTKAAEIENEDDDDEIGIDELLAVLFDDNEEPSGDEAAVEDPEDTEIIDH